MDQHWFYYINLNRVQFSSYRGVLLTGNVHLNLKRAVIWKMFRLVWRWSIWKKFRPLPWNIMSDTYKFERWMSTRNEKTFCKTWAMNILQTSPKIFYDVWYLLNNQMAILLIVTRFCLHHHGNSISSDNSEKHEVGKPNAFSQKSKLAPPLKSIEMKALSICFFFSQVYLLCTGNVCMLPHASSEQVLPNHKSAAR